MVRFKLTGPQPVVAPGHGGRESVFKVDSGEMSRDGAAMEGKKNCATAVWGRMECCGNRASRAPRGPGEVSPPYCLIAGLEPIHYNRPNPVRQHYQRKGIVYNLSRLLELTKQAICSMDTRPDCWRGRF
ncbi:hypothetical protein RRG08_033982 [Elysia crispata]|uniref:Uncharacterized protein n=1 Tax=Elysia crispata TaxID=231223 RepID=A0AAE1D3H5_9GAST|nr:hypothetical protein RRG08_033982 [Elysia crispata]